MLQCKKLFDIPITESSRFIFNLLRKSRERRVVRQKSRANDPNVMYESLLLPWSRDASQRELIYRAAGLVKTQGTIFLLPPSRDVLTTTFNSPPKPKSRMSAGAVALCKHFERGGASSEHGRPHPFWPLPKGSNDTKSMLAAQILENMLDDARWQNVMMLHAGVAVFEVRNSLGYGMRWTLIVEDLGYESEATDELTSVTPKDDLNGFSNEDGELISGNKSRLDDKFWKITNVSFRGFLEPIIGLDHELAMST